MYNRNLGSVYHFIGFCMNTMFSVDVVIPTWNRGGLLKRAVNSVLEQGVELNRVVVVDNGSIPACLKGVDDKRIQLIKTDLNIGASAARNAGAFFSEAEIIAFLDDDDYWQPGFLSAAVQLFECGADIVVGRLMRQTESGSLNEYKLLGSSVAAQRALYFCNPGFGGQNFLVRRCVYERLGGFDASMPASNDRDFAVRALQAGAVIMVQPASVAVLCDHAGERVRHKQVAGNYRFIRKHWQHMTWMERYRACRTLAKRYLYFKLIGVSEILYD